MRKSELTEKTITKLIAKCHLMSQILKKYADKNTEKENLKLSKNDKTL